MKIQQYENQLIGFVYFIILLLIAFFVRDIPNQYNVFDLTILQLMQVSVMGDPASFATAAIDIAKNGWISSENTWIFNLWPPGFILLEALIIKIFGINVPIILVLQILAAVLFSVVMTLLFKFLNDYVNKKIALVLPLLIFVFPVSRVFLLEPIGITLGESFAIGFFLLGVLFAIRSVEKSVWRYAVYSGISLALAAYFRSQFEIILLALTGCGVLLLILLNLARTQIYLDSTIIKSTVKTISIVLLVAHAITIPWRVYHWMYQESPLWVHTASVTFGNSVMTSEYLESVHGGFVVAGGGNLVCRINPATCGDTANAKTLFIKTFLEHPGTWYSLKVDIIGKYWLSSLQNWSAVGTESTLLDIIINSLNLILLIMIIYLLFNRRVMNSRGWIILVWISATLFSSYFLIFTVQQFEVRYFYFPKIVGIFLFIITLALYLHTKNKPIKH